MTKPSISYYDALTIYRTLQCHCQPHKHVAYPQAKNSLLCSIAVTPVMRWLPEHMSSTLWLEDSIISTVTPSPGCVAGASQLLLKMKRHLVHKITCGAANTAYQLKILSNLNIGLHMVSTALERASLKSSVRQNGPFLSSAWMPGLLGALALCSGGLEQVDLVR